MYGPKPECKVTDTRNWVDRKFSGPITQFGDVYAVEMPAQGPSSYERVGNCISLDKIEITWKLYPRLVGADDYVYQEKLLKLALVYDRNFNQDHIPVSFNEVFEDLHSNGSTFSMPYSGPDLKEETRFLVLREWNYSLPGFYYDVVEGVKNPFPVDQQHFRSVLHEFVDLSNLKTLFEGLGNSDLDVTTGRLFFMTACMDHTEIDDIIPGWGWFGKFRLFYH